MNRLATGIAIGTALGAAGLAMALSDRTVRRRIVKGSAKIAKRAERLCHH